MDGKIKQYYIECGIKPLWHHRTLNDFVNDDEAKEAVIKYLSKLPAHIYNGTGVYLYGANGTGKSHLLNCIFKNAIAQEKKVKLFSMDEIVDRFTMAWYSNEEKKELQTILHNVDLLGIDEFGKNVDAEGNPVYLPDMVKRIMESVIRNRVQMQKPIFIASNTEPKYVAKVFSEDIASLLNEAVIDICVRGSDYRKKIGSDKKRKL